MSIVPPRPLPDFAEYLAKRNAPKEPKERRRMKPISDKRAGENAEYRKQRLIFLAKHPRCACECGGRSTEVHHAAGRERWLLLDQRYWRAMTHKCHKRVQDDKQWAIAKGLRLEVTRGQQQQGE